MSIVLVFLILSFIKKVSSIGGPAAEEDNEMSSCKGIQSPRGKEGKMNKGNYERSRLK